MNRAGGMVEPTPPECALAAEMFDHFCSAGTMKQILALHREICDTLNLKPNRLPDFYPKLKAKLASSWKAQALFKKFDARANHKVYGKGRVCAANKVLIIGAGPCGLRAAIECQLLGAKVVVIEKRDRMSRNNVLHLWPFVIHDLRALGAKKFFGKFCAGSIDHISIRQLQCILLKVALLLGVEFHEGVSFEELLEPTVTANNESLGWRANVSPSNHPVSMYEFDALVGADGKRNTLGGFKRKEFRGKLAMAITANFINRHSEQEASVPEISGVAFIFNQKFFKDLKQATGIDLENIVYYKDDTHYFVMTAKKQSLIDKGVLLNDFAEVSRLLSVENVDRAALMRYAQEAARFSTGGRLPLNDFALNHYGEPDVALFDFTSMYAAENASMVYERMGRRLLCQLVGDSLLEPFWPTGSGCARGFLSALDAAWAVRSWGHSPQPHPLHVVAERESIYRLLGQTTSENLHRDLGSFTLDPGTRYRNLNRTLVAPHRVACFYDADEPLPLDAPSSARKRRRESDVPEEVLASWLAVPNLKAAVSGALAAAVRRYRPDLLPDSAAPAHLYLVLHRELGIPPPVGSNGGTLRDIPESKLRSYLSKVYSAFKGEVPHVQHSSQVFHQLKQQAERRTNNDNSISAYSNAAEADKSHSSYKRKRRARAEEGRIVGGGGRTAGGGARVAKLAAELSGNNTQVLPKASKPKDLMRSVGKIERDDWNMKEIEKKILENRLGRPEPRAAEKVPKWDREQFLGRQRKLKGDGSDEKWGEIDETLHKLDQKLRDSGRPDHGTNKVANLANKFVNKDPEPEPVKIQPKDEKKSWRGPMTAGAQCTACGMRVFAAEGVIADGLTVHRACFRCAVCRTVLRPGSYTMERFGSRLVCLRHSGVSATDGASKTPRVNAVATPERISVELSDSAAREIDEDEWTDRNCLASETSAANNLSDDEESSSDEFTDAVESDAAPQRSPSPERIPALAHDIYLSDDSYPYDDYTDDGNDSSGNESCSRMRALREARRREVPADARPPTDSSEVESEEESSSDEESVSSGTEVSTDSEFARDEGHLPAILVTPAPTISIPPVAQTPREYPLSRTMSAGGLATQRALELKRKYLLGEPSPPAVRKSDSTSQIDSKLAAFTNNITEFQKMLNPAAPTPTLAYAKVDQPMPDIIKNLCTTAPVDLLAKTEKTLLHDYIISERSEPGSESARLEQENDALDSDSLSERTETGQAGNNPPPPPRLEVHDEGGELIQLDSLVTLDSEEQITGTNTSTAPTVLPADKKEDSSSSREASTLALTESEGSSWAGEGSLETSVGRRAPTNLAKPKTVQLINDDLPHVCGRTDSNEVRFLNAQEHFAFADEGDAIEETLPPNRGYMELVDSPPDHARDRSMDFIERAFSETVYRIPPSHTEIVHTLPPDLNVPYCDSNTTSPTKTDTESSEKTSSSKSHAIPDKSQESEKIHTAPDSHSKSEKSPTESQKSLTKSDVSQTESEMIRTKADTNDKSESRSENRRSIHENIKKSEPSSPSAGIEPGLESLSLSSMPSPPLASPSEITQAEADAEAGRVARLRRERDHQTEVVRRLVLARLGGVPPVAGQKRRPRLPPIPFTPPVTPPVMAPPPPVPPPPCPAPAPALSDPELARASPSPRRNNIMRTISVYINRHLHPKHKWASEPNLSSHQEPLSRVNHAHKSTGALLEGAQEPPPVPPPPAGYCPPLDKTRYIAPRIPAEQQAATVAELVQVSATRDAHQALLNADRRRSAASGGD